MSKKLRQIWVDDSFDRYLEELQEKVEEITGGKISKAQVTKMIPLFYNVNIKDGTLVLTLNNNHKHKTKHYLEQLTYVEGLPL